MLKIKLPSKLPELLDDNGSPKVNILKIICEDKFYIAKTINIPWMVKELQKNYGKYLRGGIYETSLFYPLVKYIYSHEAHKLKIEVLFTTTNGYEALKYELGLLEEWFGKKQCLNKNNIPYIPKTVVAKKGSNWLTQNQALNFRKLLTKYEF